MVGIGETLRAERRRQGRTLADAAAETRVRESYLAAIEEDDFAVLGGDVYARGFIRLYGRYLDLDADALVEAYRQQHDAGQAVTVIPAAAMDDILPPSDGPRIPLSPPALAAVGLVALLVVMFFVFRGGGGEEAAEEDPNAPGPVPAEVSDQPDATALEGTESSLADMPADPLIDGPAPNTVDGPLLEELSIEVTVLSTVRMHVLRGQPPVTNATLNAGTVRNLTGDPAVVFQVSDAAAIDVSVNGLPLAVLGGPGQAIQVSCVIGRPGCDVDVL